MAKRIGVCVLVLAMMFSALSTNAAAATSNPIIIQTGPLGNILNIIAVLGGGTLLDTVPGTNIYLVNLPNLPVVTPLLQSLLGIVFMEPDTRVVNPARGQMGVL